MSFQTVSAAAEGMASQDSASIIHKKARVAREDFDARAMSPAKAMRMAFAKLADSMFDMALSVTTVEQVIVKAARLETAMGDDGLLILLDGAGGACGAAKFDVQFTAALIEAQITGSVRQAAATARPYTPTDAAMIAPYLDSVLAGYVQQLEEDGVKAGPYRFGDKLENSRALTLTLERGEFDLFRLTVDIANGAKTGNVSVVLPHQPTAESTSQSRGASNARQSRSLKRNALDAHVVLDAVLARLRMPLRDICKLVPGEVLALPLDALGEAQLMATGRHEMAEVKLGQMGGMRAVRLTGSNLLENGSTPTPPSLPETQNPDQYDEAQPQATDLVFDAGPIEYLDRSVNTESKDATEEQAKDELIIADHQITMASDA